MGSLLAAQLRAKLESQEIGVNCPRCATETPRTIGWMLANNRLSCPQCGAVIELDTSKLHAAVGNVEETARKLDANLSRAAEILSQASDGAQAGGTPNGSPRPGEPDVPK